MGRLGEPFWRRDESRSVGEHAGLGLALVSAVSGLLGLSVRYEQEDDGTFHARIEGPALGTERAAEGPVLAASADPQEPRRR
jgi:hypothetical protein